MTGWPQTRRGKSAWTAFLGLRMNSSFLFILGRRLWIGPPPMSKGVAPSWEPADTRAYGSADQAKEPTADHHSGSDRGPVASAFVHTDCCPNAEADCRPNQSMSSVAMIHPRSLVAAPVRISPLGRKWPSRPSSGKLRQGCVVGIGRAVGGLCISTPRRRDRVLSRGAVGHLRISGLCSRARREQNRCQQ
jgi:hypothetical protein